jgi:hypothetical protein
LAAPQKASSLPAIEAFHRAIHVRPRALREGRDLGGSIISVWTTGDLGEYEIPPMREPMIALHTGGVPRFQTRLGDRWSEPSLPGQVYWIPADLKTVWRINGPLQFVAVHFGGRALERIASETGISGREVARLPFRPGFHDAFASSACAMLAEEACRSPGERSRFAELLANTLAVSSSTEIDAAPRTSSAAASSTRRSIASRRASDRASRSRSSHSRLA